MHLRVLPHFGDVLFRAVPLDARRGAFPAVRARQDSSVPRRRCCFDIPNRKQVGKQSYLESCMSIACCFNVCGRVQLARELGIEWKSTDKLKSDTSMSADLLKNDIMMQS